MENDRFGSVDVNFLEAYGFSLRSLLANVRVGSADVVLAKVSWTMPVFRRLHAED